MTGVYPKEEVHWETSCGHITLWNHDESKVILDLTPEEARNCRDQLTFLIERYHTED